MSGQGGAALQQPGPQGISLLLWSKPMRDIAANPQSSNIFYMAADQAMLGQLRHKEGSVYRTPTASFRYMVGTILLETALRFPGNAHTATHTRLLAMTLGEFNRLSEL